jgi:hypothetical protein
VAHGEWNIENRLKTTPSEADREDHEMRGLILEFSPHELIQPEKALLHHICMRR